MSFRSFIRKIIPVRASVFERANRQLQAEVSRLSKQNAAALKEIKGIESQLKSAQKTQKQILKAIQDSQKDLQGARGAVNDVLAVAHGSSNKIRHISESQMRYVCDVVKRIESNVGDVSSRQDLLLPPELYAHAIKMWYQNKTGNILDIDHPRTYNEKIQWMKINDHDPRKVMLADKVAVRDYVKQTIGEEYLIPLIGVYETVDAIDFDSLPNRFVLKASHGSGWNAIVRDKEEVDWINIKQRAQKWLKTNFAFVNGYEMHYEDIPHRLLVEEYIENCDGDIPDYKFWCFDGKVRYIMYLAERQTKLKMAFFDPDWNKLPFTYDHPRLEVEIPKPDNLALMVELAEKLAADFPHTRVDLYRLDDGSIKFGEITFSSASGSCRWNPPEADAMMGEMFVLPHSAEA